MAGIYVDTSALGRVLLVEPDAGPIRDVLDEYDEWWSSELLLVELRRLGRREGLADAAERMLEAVRLTVVDSPSLQRASRVQPISVRSLDAIHLEAAVGLHAQSTVAVVLTYDRQLHLGCTQHGLAVRAPTVG